MSNDLEKRVRAKLELDSSGFNSELKGVNAELKNTKAEFKSASEGLKTYGKNTEQLKNVQQSLTRQLELQAKKVDLYRKAMEKSSTKMEANIRARDKLKANLEGTRREMDRLTSTQSKELQAYRKNETAIKRLSSTIEKAKSKYGENSEQVKKLQQAMQKLEQEQEKLISSNAQEIKSYQKTKEELDKVEKAYNDKAKAVENNAKAVQNNNTSLNNANAEMHKTQGQLNNINRDIANSSNRWKVSSEVLKKHSDKLHKVGDSISDVGDKALRVTAPIAFAGGLAIKTGMDFESQMSRVKAISGATGEEFKELSDQALDLGAKTTFSSSQCAEGMENLSSAGFTVKETMSAMPGLLDLAASSGEDLATSSDIAASTLRGFGIEADKTAHVADVLAKNAADTNAAVADTGEAMKYVAPIAHTAGQSLEMITASIGLLADAGIKGSQAGTTLRGALTRLAKPSKEASNTMKQLGFNAFDANGKMLPLDKMIGNLQKSLTGLSDKQKQAALSTIFGQEALSGMMVLVDAGPKKLSDLTNSLKDSDGAAKQMADTMQDNAKASVEQMFGALETAAIKVEKSVAPAITSVCKGVGNLADRFSKLSPATQELVVKAIAGGVAFGGLAKVFGGTLNATASVLGGFGKLAKIVGKFSKVAGTATVVAETTTTAVSAVGTATTVAGTGATVASGGIATLGATLTGVVLPAIGVIGAIAGISYGAYKLYKYLNSSATPAVDLFADKVETSGQRIVHANGMVTVSNKETVTKISEGTKKAVSSYLNLDKKASSSLMDLRINSDKFTTDAKNKVLKNFTEMSKKSSNLSKEQREHMTVDFKKLVNDTGVLTKKNKDEIIKQYTAMVNGTKGLTDKQKKQTIKDFTDTLNKSVSITKKQSSDLLKLYKDMGDKIKIGLDKKKNEELKSLKDFFGKSNALTVKEEQDILKKTNDSWDKKKKTIDDYQKQINDIIQKASNEHRQITNDEAKTIENIQQEMKQNAVQTLSESEVESKVILERMKGNDEHITAEMASQHIKQLNQIRDKAIKSANEECDKRIAEIIRMRDESKVISADQAEKLIADAKRQRDGTVQAAEETRNQAVSKITSMSSDIVKNIDTSSGEFITKVQRMKNAWNNGWNTVKNFVVNTIFKQQGTPPKTGANWTGNSYFKGGYTTLHERGYELYNLPQGTKIFNHDASEKMVLETAKQTAKGVIKEMLGNIPNNTGDIIIPINIAGEEIDRIVVPRVSNRLAMNSRGRR